MSLPVTAEDQQKSPHPPEEDELIIRPNILVSLIVSKGETVTQNRFDQILKFLNNTLKKEALFSIIPQNTIKELLEEEENRHLQPNNVADAIELGTSVGASLVAQLELNIIESAVVDGVDEFKAQINATIFTTNSGQVVYKGTTFLDTQDPEKSNQEFKQVVQQHFPIRGFILETRGSHQVAKISLGRSMGMTLGRKMQVRERKVHKEIVDGVSRKTVSFDATALATVKVIQVGEDVSWVLVEEKDRNKIKTGQVVFTLPDTDVWQ